MTTARSKRVSLVSRMFVGTALNLALFNAVLAQSSPAPQPERPAPTPSELPTATAEEKTREAVVKLETFTVTGSNIRRAEAETSQPITIIDREAMDLRGAATPADLLDTITINNPPALTEQESAGQSARGDNQVANLRGLGSGSTLLLVNGRRMAPHPISQNEGGAPALSTNANILPGGFSERVEILRDGASAIYGSDAAAGVINYIVTPRFNGTRVTTRGMMTRDGGANEFRATILWGKTDLNDGKTSVKLDFDYFHRDPLVPADRQWAKESDLRRNNRLPAPWDGVPLTVTDPVTGVVSTVRDNDFDNSSGTNRFGQYQRGTINPDGSVSGSRPTGSAGIVTVQPNAAATMTTGGVFFLTPFDATGTTGFRSSTPSRNWDSFEKDFYQNLNGESVILPKTDRFSLGLVAEHRFRDDLIANAEVVLYHADSLTGRTGPQIDIADAPGISIGVDNPFNPFGSRFYHPTGLPNSDGTFRLTGTPSAVALTLVRPADFKKRPIEVQSTAYRALATLRGKMWNSWNWEAGLSWGGAYTKDVEYNNIRESRLREALASSDTNTAFNPFGYTFRIDRSGATPLIMVDRPYANTSAVLRNLDGNYQREAWTYLGLLDFKVDGKIWEFRGNDIEVAAGLEARYEGYKFRMPPYAGINPPSDPNPLLRPGDNDFILLSPNVNSDLDRKVYSAYTEIYHQLITPSDGIPLVRALDLTAAVRAERFPFFGDAIKPKVGLGFTPVKWLKIRASASDSFRAPNVIQTGTPRRQVFASAISDPYRFEVTGTLGDGSTGRTVFRQGAEDLLPEETVTYSVGVVIDVPGIKGLSITADAYKINQNNVITNADGQYQLDRDEEMLDIYVQQQLAAGVNINSIDLGSGTASYKGNPKVNRAPVTQADRDAYATYNANPANSNNRRAPVGPVINMVEDYVNLAGRDLDGIDFGFQYRVPSSPTFGQFTLSGEASWRHKFELQEEPDLPIGDDLYEDGRAKWRFNANLRWRKGGWSAGWGVNYYGKFVDTSALTTLAVYETLGRPDYILPFNNSGTVRYALHVAASVQHNLNVGYRFSRNHSIPLLRRTNVRFGINDVLNSSPPIADNTFGYQSGTYNPRGQSFWLEISKEL